MTSRHPKTTRRGALLLGTAALAATALPRRPLAQQNPPAPIDSRFFADKVAAGSLPPVAQRLPAPPRIIELEKLGRTPGRHGGNIRMLMGDQRDVRMMTLYGYTRLMVYDDNLELVPDVLESCEVQDGRIFTLRLRAGHRWSDGSPFTTEDFRYWWEDIANNQRLSPGGPPQALLAGGNAPLFEVLSPTEVRYSWDAPNPIFLPALAGAQPTYIFMPSAYLKQFHERHAAKHELAQRSRRTASATGARCTNACRACIGRRTQSCRRWSPGATPRRCRPSSSSSSATPSSIASTRRDGNCPMPIRSR